MWHIGDNMPTQVIESFFLNHFSHYRTGFFVADASTVRLYIDCHTPISSGWSTNGQLCMSRRRRAGAHDIVHDLSCQAPTVSKIEQHGSPGYELNRSSWQALSYSLSRCWSWGKPKVTSFLPYILIFSITAPKQMFNWRRADARDNNGNCSC